MEYKDYYAILGIEKKASPDEIKHAYRKLARKYHPDVSKEKDAEEHFKEVQEAYEVLKDPKKREAYDTLGSHWKAGQEFKPPPGWGENVRFYTSGNGSPFGETFGDFSDFFSALFGGDASQFGRRSGAHAFRERGTDERAMLSITLDEAFRGATKTFQLQQMVPDAAGRLHRQMRTMKINIPSGITQDQPLRLAKQGGEGIGGGERGDLYLTIHIEPHPYFSLKDKDIYLTLPITPWEAALGASIQTPTLGGKVELKLPAGVESGQQLRLKGKGLPGKKPGDQYVIIQIQTPKADNEEAKKYYESMAKTMPFNPRHF